MAHHNEGELKAVFQILLAIFISFVLVRFLAVFALSYSIWAPIGVAAGAAILYFSLRKNNELDFFFAMTFLLSIPFAVMFKFVL